MSLQSRRWKNQKLPAPEKQEIEAMVDALMPPETEQSADPEIIPSLDAVSIAEEISRRAARQSAKDAREVESILEREDARESAAQSGGAKAPSDKAAAPEKETPAAGAAKKKSRKKKNKSAQKPVQPPRQNAEKAPAAGTAPAQSSGQTSAAGGAKPQAENRVAEKQGGDEVQSARAQNDVQAASQSKAPTDGSSQKETKNNSKTPETENGNTKKKGKNQPTIPQAVNFSALTQRQRAEFLASAAKQQKKRARRLVLRRSLGLCAGLALCFGLAAAVQWLHTSRGLAYPFVLPLTQTAEKEPEVLEAPMPDVYGTVEPALPTQEPEKETWMLLLANTDNPLPQGYEKSVTFTQPFANSYQQIDVRASDALKAMFAGAEKDGIYLYFRSGYRSHETQIILFNSMLQEYQNGSRTGTPMTYEQAYAATKQLRNIPGTSEHETGLAADIVSAYNPSVDLTTYLADTPECKWLKEHCAEYGFILRYPKDKTQITGTSFEPWHFRYVGKDAAQKIMQQGICLEEYLGAA